MTPDERTALNEAVCKRLGWVRLDDYHWQTIGAGYVVPTTQIDFTSDWNAVYRWIVPAVKEMPIAKRAWFLGLAAQAGEEASRLEMPLDNEWTLHATPEDYCRAFLAVTEVDDD